MKKQPSIRTYSLFPTSNFWTGFGSMFSIFGNYYLFNFSKSAKEADLKALESDWQEIGNDISISVERFHKKNKISKTLN